jgi:hypothetical protein
MHESCDKRRTTSSAPLLYRPHSSWVATRRGLDKLVSSSPPFKTGLAPLRASGLTPLINLLESGEFHIYGPD